jgi:hypothetical protein
VAVAYGTLARVATAYYSIAHNAVDNDLTVRVGSDLDYDPGTLGGADFEILGPGENAQDSALVVLPSTIPPNTGTSTVGTIEHFWSVGFKQGDGAEPYLPPTQAHPWFLNVMDGGYVNRTGRATSFSLFVNDSPGSAGGTTYVTDHQPMPQPLIEGGEVAVTLWIPEMNVTAVPAATFTGEARDGEARLVLVLAAGDPGATARVYRSRSEDFASRELLTSDPIAIEGTRFEFEDRSVVSGVRYHYWVELRGAAGGVIWNGPVSLVIPARPAVTLASAPRPNPVRGRASFDYTIGADAAGGGLADVSIAILDLQGRLVRTLKQAREGVGNASREWDATDGRGVRVEAALYYLQLARERRAQERGAVGGCREPPRGMWALPDFGSSAGAGRRAARAVAVRCPRRRHAKTNRGGARGAAPSALRRGSGAMIAKVPPWGRRGSRSGRRRARRPAAS